MTGSAETVWASGLPAAAAIAIVAAWSIVVLFAARHRRHPDDAAIGRHRAMRDALRRRRR